MNVSSHKLIFLVSKKFADALDRFDKDHAFVHQDRDFVWEYLGGTITDKDEDTRSTMMDMNYWEKCTTPTKMDSAVHVLLRYKLLDILSGVLDLEKHPSRVQVPQVALPMLPTRVQQVNPAFIHLYSH